MRVAQDGLLGERSGAWDCVLEGSFRIRTYTAGSEAGHGQVLAADNRCRQTVRERLAEWWGRVQVAPVAAGWKPEAVRAVGQDRRPGSGLARLDIPIARRYDPRHGM